MKKVNLTIELLDEEEIYQFEHWIRQYVSVTDFMILTDTKELYDTDTHFRKITKEYLDAKRVRNDYINKKIPIKNN